MNFVFCRAPGPCDNLKIEPWICTRRLMAGVPAERTNDSYRPLQHQYCTMYQLVGMQMPGELLTGVQRRFDRRLWQGIHLRGYQGRAQIRIVFQGVGRCPINPGMFHAYVIGNQGGSHVGLRSRRRQNRLTVCDSHAQAAPSPSTGRNSAYRHDGADFERPVQVNVLALIPAQIRVESDPVPYARRHMQGEIATFVAERTAYSLALEIPDEFFGDRARYRCHGCHKQTIHIGAARLEHTPGYWAVDVRTGCRPGSQLRKL